MSILISILAILLMILVHEWGHFIAARICDVPVYEFAIGFGPAIWKKQGKKGTVYSVRVIPLGGFCSFDKISKDETVNGLADLALEKISYSKKAFISFAGPLMNFIFGFIVIFIVNLTTGHNYVSTEIGKLSESNVVSEYIEPGDTVISVNGVNVENEYDKMNSMIQSSNGQTVHLEFRHNDEIRTADVAPAYNPEDKCYRLGVVMTHKMEPESITSALWDSVKFMGESIFTVYDSLVGIVSGKYDVSEVSGIVGTVAVMSSLALQSIVQFFTVVSLVSINLGVMNLLPIPPLDGFKIVSGAIEKVIKRKLNQKAVVIMSVTCFCLLICVSVLLVAKDVLDMI